MLTYTCKSRGVTDNMLDKGERYSRCNIRPCLNMFVSSKIQIVLEREKTACQVDWPKVTVVRSYTVHEAKYPWKLYAETSILPILSGTPVNNEFIMLIVSCVCVGSLVSIAMWICVFYSNAISIYVSLSLSQWTNNCIGSTASNLWFWACMAPLC